MLSLVQFPLPRYDSSSPNLDKSIQPPIKLLTSDRHLDCIKRILHHIVRIQLVYLLHHGIDIRLLGFCKEQKLRASLRLEALDAEVAGFEDFEAGCAHGEGEGCIGRG